MPTIDKYVYLGVEFNNAIDQMANVVFKKVLIKLIEVIVKNKKNFNFRLLAQQKKAIKHKYFILNLTNFYHYLVCE